MAASDVTYKVSAVITDGEMNSLHSASWLGHEAQQFGHVLERSLAYVTAYAEDRLVGFVNLAWDGGEHSFVLDTLVNPQYGHRGIGSELVKSAVEEARSCRVKWVHVDFEPHLTRFYRDCGFRHTEAGLVRTDCIETTV